VSRVPLFSGFIRTWTAAAGMTSLLFLVPFLAVLFHDAASAGVSQKKHVLVLNSYHSGLSWTDNIIRGIESVLLRDSGDIELHLEFMDTKRYLDSRYFQRLLETYRYKYRNSRFDVIIATDNDAFNFLREHHGELFPGTPVVFCGVNYFKDSMLEGHGLFTGVVEETDIRSTIEVALKLHPDTKRIVAVNDRTTTGIAVKNEVLEVEPYFRDKVSFVFLEDFSMSELQEKIRDIPSRSIILLTVFNYDRTGQFFTYEESLALIRPHTKAPVYSIWDFYLGGGIVGGMLTSGFQQGKTSGEIALRILNGEAVSTIPVVRKSPNRYMFDYKELQRFRIRQSDLPADSIVINLPDTFYARYRNFILMSSAIILTLTLIIFVLLFNISMRKRFEKALRDSEEKYRDLYNNAPDMYHSINRDGIVIDCNDTEAKMLGYRKEEIIGRPIADFLTEESRKTYEREFATLRGHPALYGLERELVRKDGTTFTASLNVFIELDEKGELIRTKTIGRDITERKRAEEELRRSREELRNLSAHIESAREEERGHIAREIHDELGQILSKLKLDLSWLRKRLPDEQGQLVEKTEKMSALVDTTIQAVQRISSELRPGVLDYLGLAAAVEWQANEFRERTGISCSVVISPDVAVGNQGVATAVFRIFQETLTNVIRHANAARVEVALRKEDNTLMLEVRDNGKGIPEEKVSDHASFGLMGMRERARFLGGKVSITGVPGKGTTVTVIIPLDGAVPDKS
jgi:PAS domain S-box-containing protein